MEIKDNENSEENLDKIENQKEEQLKNNLDINDEIVERERVQIKISLVLFIFIIMVVILLIVACVRTFNQIDNENQYRRTFESVTINGIMYDAMDTTAKPIIYIYPEQEIEISVRVGRPELLTTTYPKYNEEEGWQVIAEPEGTLIDCKTGRELYALYWEGINSKKYSEDLEEGFVISGEDTAQFLEEKLEILGLNAREAEEFIVYWLPQMEHNNYNYIRFQTQEEINKNMPLEIEPSPETLIRVMMEWKGLDKEIEVKQQNLEKVERKGYTVVEWGGTEIDFNVIN